MSEIIVVVDRTYMMPVQSPASALGAGFLVSNVESLSELNRKTEARHWENAGLRLRCHHRVEPR